MVFTPQQKILYDWNPGLWWSKSLKWHLWAKFFCSISSSDYSYLQCQRGGDSGRLWDAQRDHRLRGVWAASGWAWEDSLEGALQAPPSAAMEDHPGHAEQGEGSRRGDNDRGQGSTAQTGTAKSATDCLEPRMIHTRYLLHQIIHF